MTLPEIKQIYHPCGELSTLTKGHSPANNNLPSELTPDVFNAHFVSVVSKFLPDDQTDGYSHKKPADEQFTMDSECMTDMLA